MCNKIYIGTYSKQDLINKKDKEDIKKKQDLFPDLKYVYSEQVFKGKEVVALKVYLSNIYI